MIARNPVQVHAPLADYSHQIEVGAGGRWLVLSGQVGARLDGTVPQDPIRQVEAALTNLGHNLAAAGMTVHHVVKLTLYLVGEVDAAARRAAVSSWLAGHEPCMTLLYVAGLAAPQYRVEIDAWAHSDEPAPSSAAPN